MPAKLILLSKNLVGIYKAHKIPLICSICKKELNEGSLIVRKIKGKHRAKLYCIKCAIERNVIDVSVLESLKEREEVSYKNGK